MDFGLVAFGEALGEPVPVADVVKEYSEDVERILGYGYRQVLRCAPGTGLTDLAVDAAGRALAGSGTAPGDIDLVVLAITDIPEYLYWDAAASVAHRVGADRAEAILLSQGCTAGVLSLDTVAGRLATHPGYRNALVVAVNRTCEAYWNRMDTQPMVFSDGAAACVARRGHGSLRWRATEALTDGAYADLYRLDAGGAAAPFADGRHDAETLRARDAWAVMDFFDYDLERFEEFVAGLNERTFQVVDAACGRLGWRVAELAKIIVLSDNAEAMESLARRLGVPPDRTNVELGQRYGHLGAADQLFALGRYAGDGQFRPGDRIALVSRGRGMHWACTLLEA